MKRNQNYEVTRKPDKGSKYDVETSYHLRFPYMADRLRHPEFLANPFQRLFRFIQAIMINHLYNIHLLVLIQH